MVRFSPLKRKVPGSIPGAGTGKFFWSKTREKRISHSPDPIMVGGIENLVLSETDDKIGGPVCTRRTLKNPWQ